MSSKPRISEQEAKEILKANKTTDSVCLIGIRGYYEDSIGKPGENDRNVYDDAMIIVSGRHFETFRANTDPSVYRKGIATMATGVHRYYKGKHKNRYWALRLVGEKVAVTRDGQSGTAVGVALNIHKGGIRSTGSEGCQTLSPADWDDFIEIVYDEMAFYGQKTIPYVLIDEKDRRRGGFKMPLSSEKEKETDNLLIRFDEKEPAAQVGTQPDKPASKPALVPSAASSDSQPQTAGVSTTQPVPSNSCPAQDNAPNNRSLDTLDAYIGKMQSAADRAEQIQNAFAPISNSSWAMTLISKLLGIVLFFFALLKDNWRELLVAALLIGIGAFIYSRAKDRAVAKQTAVRQ